MSRLVMVNCVIQLGVCVVGSYLIKHGSWTVGLALICVALATTALGYVHGVECERKINHDVQVERNNLANSLAESLSVQRHAFGNKLQVIIGLIQLGDTERCIRYIKSLDLRAIGVEMPTSSISAVTEVSSESRPENGQAG